MHFSILDCDAYHHHYHYQASAQYLWLARALLASGHELDAAEARRKALFQDHQNAEASDASSIDPPHYDKHPALDAEFCRRTGDTPSAASAPHDAGIAAEDMEQALECFNNALATDNTHSNSFFARGKIWFLRGEFEKARADFAEAVRLSHLQHDSYHRSASDAHVARGREFFARGEVDLAIADFSKALDLYRRNADAFEARANAYNAKGSDALARADEEMVLSLRAPGTLSGG